MPGPGGWWSTPETPGHCYRKIKALTEALEAVLADGCMDGNLTEIVETALAYNGERL